MIRNSRLLLVNADPVVEELATRTLRHMGAEVHVATGADEGLRLLQTESFGVVLADGPALGVLLPTVATCNPRPIVIGLGVSGELLDAELVTMVVPPGYDAHMLVGVLLACLNNERLPLVPNGLEILGETR